MCAKKNDHLLFVLAAKHHYKA